MAWPLAGLLVVAVVAAGLLWLLRDRVAVFMMARWCEARGLTCDADVEDIGLNGVDIARLVVRADGATPLETGHIHAELGWPSWMQPQLTALSVAQPVVRLRYDGERLDAYGLERLLEGEGQGGGTLPRFEVTDGRAEVETPAGTLSGSFSLAGEDSRNLEARVSMPPARLASAEGEIAWSRGDFDLKLVEGRASGQVRLGLDHGRFEGVTISNAVFDAQLQPVEANGPIAVEWSGELDAARTSTHRLESIRTRGSLKMDRVEVSGLPALLAAIDSAIVNLEAGQIDTGRISGRATRLDADLQRIGGELRGPVAIEAQDAIIDDHGAAELALTGDARIGASGAAQLAGQVVLKQARLSPDLRQSLAEAVALEGLLEAHGRQLAGELDAALTDFDTGADFVFEMAEDARWSLTADSATQLQSASGLRARIDPFDNRRWLALGDGALELSGDIRLRSERSGLDLAGRLAELQTGPDSLRIIARKVLLDTYKAEQRAFAVDLEDLSYEQTPSGLRASALGTVTLEGDLPGASLHQTSLFGGIDAVRGVEGWRIQTRGARCLGLDSAGASFQSLSIGSFALALCPEDGRFLQQRGGNPEGTVTLDTFRLPFSTGRTEGNVGLDVARLEWSIDGGLYTRLTGDALSLALDTGGQTLMIDGRRAQLEASAGPAPLRIAGALREIGFSGSLVPVAVSAASAEFVLNDRTDGPAGQASLDTVRISDPAADPVFEPLLASATARLQSGTITIEAPLRIAKTGLLVGNGRLQLGFPQLDGFGSFATETLRFGPGRLQPHDLSDRLRGFFTDARGEASAAADFLIEAGEVTGTGWAQLEEFGFQTLAFSRVRGVNGRVDFDSLFPLSTPPGQAFTVAEIDPGLALLDGEVRFQLIRGQEARLESAVWPFAGGFLSVMPGVWRVAGGDNTVTVEAKSLSLQALSTVLSVPGLNAEGTVSGRFPVEFSGGSAFIRNARLTADTAGGRLSYTGRIADQAASTNENVALAFRALEDFDFRVLEIGADGDVAGDITVTARLLGHNDDVLGGAEFDFNVSVDSQLAQLLSTSRQWTGTDWLAEIEARRAENESPTDG